MPELLSPKVCEKDIQSLCWSNFRTLTRSICSEPQPWSSQSAQPRPRWSRWWRLWRWWFLCVWRFVSWNPEIDPWIKRYSNLFLIHDPGICITHLKSSVDIVYLVEQQVTNHSPVARVPEQQGKPADNYKEMVHFDYRTLTTPTSSPTLY